MPTSSKYQANIPDIDKTDGAIDSSDDSYGAMLDAQFDLKKGPMATAAAYGLMDLDLSDLSSDEELDVYDSENEVSKRPIHAPIMDTILEGFEEDSFSER